MIENQKQLIWKIIAAICVCICIACVFCIVVKDIKASNSQKDLEQIKEQIENEEQAKTSKENEFVSPIDFSALQQINTDIIAWIKIDDTKIDYPICYSETDNKFYLNHDHKKKATYQGSIFIENYNHKDLNDFNTLIYGHSLLNGNMFQDLHKFSNKDFFNEHDTIILYLPYETRYYSVFETEVVSDKHVLSIVDNSSEKSCEDYINNILNNKSSRTIIRENTELSVDDKIITLSTCMSDDTKRLNVHAVLTKTEN